MMKTLFLLLITVILLSQCAHNKFDVLYDSQRNAYVVKPENTNAIIEFPRDNMNSKEKTGSYFSVKSTKNDSHEIVLLVNEKGVVSIMVLENLNVLDDKEIDPLIVDITNKGNEEFRVDEVKRVAIFNKKNHVRPTEMTEKK